MEIRDLTEARDIRQLADMDKKEMHDIVTPILRGFSIDKILADKAVEKGIDYKDYEIQPDLSYTGDGLGYDIYIRLNDGKVKHFKKVISQANVDKLESVFTQLKDEILSGMVSE